MTAGPGRLEAFSDHINPMVVKELRQMVRGKWVSGSLIFFLMLLLVILTIFMANTTETNFSQGPSIFMGFLSTLVFVTLFFVPFSVAAKIGREREDENSDLLYITNLTPAKIIFGKLASGMVTTALFFTAAMPFMSLTYLLRGIDVPTILLINGGTYLVVLTMIQIFIFMACIAPNRGARTILGLLGLSGISVVYSILTSFYGSALFGSMSGWFSWTNIGIFLASVLFLTGSFFLFSVAALKPHAYNRSLPVRVWLTLWWTLVLVVGGGISHFGADFLLGWGVFGSILGMLGVLYAICEREEHSLRIRRTIPRTSFKRFFAFFFWSGAGGGMAWSLSILILSLAVLFPVSLPMGHEDLFDPVLGLAIYSCAYAWTTHLLYRRFFSQRLAKGYAWVLLLGLLVLGTFLPWAISFLIFGKQGMDLDALPFLFFTNPFTILENNFMQSIFGWTFVWLLLVAVLEGPWFIRQVQAFRPLIEPEAESEVDRG